MSQHMPGGRGAVVALVVSAILLCAAAVAFFVIRAIEPHEVVEEPAEDDVASGSSDPASEGEWPVFITTMTHLEGGWTEAATNRVFFDRQADAVRHGMDIAEAYDALLTVESEIPMAEGMVNFDDNLLQEALERGHGVGTHCDINPRTSFTDVQMIAEFSARKDAIDALVSADENRGCSGGGTDGDWYTGAVGAGFDYLNGVVGFHYLALPLSQRPSGWTNPAIAREYFHYPAPQDWDKYFHPFFISALGFDEDPDGDLLLSEGALGAIQNLAEAGTPWQLDLLGDCGRSTCPFDDDDVQAATDFLDDFLDDHDGSRPAKVTFYIATEIFKDANDDTLRAFFAAMQEYVDAGKVEWATQGDVYDAMIEYRN